MSGEPSKPKDFRFNFQIVMEETRRWPVATAICLTILAALVALKAIEDQPQNTIYLAINVIGFLSGALGMKALGHLTTYAMFHKKRFPGSFLVATGIAMVPIFVFYACGFYMLGVQDDKFPPPIAMLILFGIGYPLFTVFFAGFLRAQQWIQLNQAKLWRRKE